MIGQAVARTMIGIEALASLDDDAVVALYVPAVRAALAGGKVPATS